MNYIDCQIYKQRAFIFQKKNKNKSLPRMNFDYSVQTNNRYNLFFDQEDIDPSELLAKVSVTTEKSKDTKAVKSKPGVAGAKTSKPLQQSDNKNKDESGKST